MLYDRQVTGNLQKELQTLESWAQTYPRDAYAPGIIAGWVASEQASMREGFKHLKKQCGRILKSISLWWGCLPQFIPGPVH